MLERLGARISRWATGALWSGNIGIARTLIALSGAGTLLFSPMSAVIRPGAGIEPPHCDGLLGLSLWCVTPREADEVVKYLALAVLALAASGYRPRVTAIPLWWVLWGNQASFISVDGGDQIAAMLALILIPHSLTDERQWHWIHVTTSPADEGGYRAFLARTTITVVQLQVALIYLDACVSKLAVPEWADGSALYYWLRDPMFAPTGPVRWVTDALSLQPASLALLTWGTLALEFILAIAIVLPRKAKLLLLPAGVLFHGTIAVMMGLWSFAFAIWAGLLVALWWDGDLLRHLRDLGASWSARVRTSRTRRVVPEPTR